MLYITGCQGKGAAQRGAKYFRAIRPFLIAPDAAVLTYCQIAQCKILRQRVQDAREANDKSKNIENNEFKLWSQALEIENDLIDIYVDYIGILYDEDLAFEIVNKSAHLPSTSSLIYNNAASTYHLKDYIAENELVDKDRKKTVSYRELQYRLMEVKIYLTQHQLI